MSDFSRGKIYRIDLEPTRGSEQQGNARPCVILSITPLNQRFRHLGVVPLSSSGKVLAPIVIAVPSAGVDSVALCHQFRTIDKSRIGKYLGDMSPKDMAAIEDGIRQIYGL
jgi:mRNA interferase MazF